MRIAVVIHEFPPVGGGAATAALHTCRALAALGHDVLVITAGGRDLPAHSSDHGVTVVRLPSLRLRRLAPSALELLSFCGSAWWQLADRIRDFQADAVLAYFAVPAGYFAVRAARRLGLPSAVSVRGSDVPGFAKGRLAGPLGALAHPAIRSALSGTDVVAPNSDVLRRLALEFMPEIADKIEIVSNGIEDSVVADSPASSGSDRLHVIQVGQLIERKRVHVTIDAVARMIERGRSVHLTVVGDGPLAADLFQRAADQGLDGHVEFTGHLPRAAILEKLRGQDVFVMTSAAEGMSNALLEAMASGLPVIITANGSHDIVQSAGCGDVVDADPALVAECLEKLADDPARRTELARAGLEYAGRRTWTACAQQFESLLCRDRA